MPLPGKCHTRTANAECGIQTSLKPSGSRLGSDIRSSTWTNHYYVYDWTPCVGIPSAPLSDCVSLMLCGRPAKAEADLRQTVINWKCLPSLSFPDPCHLSVVAAQLPSRSDDLLNGHNRPSGTTGHQLSVPRRLPHSTAYGRSEALPIEQTVVWIHLRATVKRWRPGGMGEGWGVSSHTKLCSNQAARDIFTGQGALGFRGASVRNVLASGILPSDGTKAPTAQAMAAKGEESREAVGSSSEAIGGVQEVCRHAQAAANRDIPPM
ncbi:hypothetical protein EYF80_006004 [Liparis tanakae]|uniref:Uncharacterized protein n=1 Tax=Liparis tanakae TaxID=230148 RepID=A0A4Z2J288_9TELE|nr:hypothetical protein EYF80_006004 [Liparis tanakae]